MNKEINMDGNVRMDESVTNCNQLTSTQNDYEIEEMNYKTKVSSLLYELFEASECSLLAFIEIILSHELNSLENHIIDKKTINLFDEDYEWGETHESSREIVYYLEAIKKMKDILDRVKIEDLS